MKGEASLLTDSKRKKRLNSRFLYVPRIVVRDDIDIERRIDRQEPTTTRQSRDVQLFGDLISLHRQDLKEVGKDIGRSKDCQRRCSKVGSGREAVERSIRLARC